MRAPSFCGLLALCHALAARAVAPLPKAPEAVAEVQADQQKSGRQAPFLPGIRRPAGVNLGGWLCLEDWFFSGPSGRHVSTPSWQKEGQGSCLPPLMPHAEEPWPSEGILVHRLKAKFGAAKAVDVLEAHRHSFVEDSDLRKIGELGVRLVRVPLNWVAFAHGLAPIAPAVYGAHNPAKDSVVVPDPFYANTSSFVTIPNDWLKELLVRGHRFGLKFVLDLHAFPGGAGDGTYNGVWPQPPVFWNSSCRIGNTSVTLQAAGLMIVEAFLQWADSLTGPARHALGGVTLMNEPGHMAAANGWEPPFVRPAQVLRWLGDATKLFMKRPTLRFTGVKLYMSLISTAFPPDTFWDMTTPWWNGLLNAYDRYNHAVFDMHWYAAWNGPGGSIGEISQGVAMLCDRPLEEIRWLLRYEADMWAKEFAGHVDGLKSCTEFSASTYKDAVLACNDLDVTNAFLDAQVEVMNKNDIEGFFWSWKMPYGPTFERGWSLEVNAHMEDITKPHPCSLASPSDTEQRQTVLASNAPFFVHGPGKLAGLPHTPSDVWTKLVQTVLS